jgi:hypothetical protein
VQVWLPLCRPLFCAQCMCVRGFQANASGKADAMRVDPAGSCGPPQPSPDMTTQNSLYPSSIVKMCGSLRNACSRSCPRSCSGTCTASRRLPVCLCLGLSASASASLPSSPSSRARATSQVLGLALHSTCRRANGIKREIKVKPSCCALREGGGGGGDLFTIGIARGPPSSLARSPPLGLPAK